MCLRLCVRVLHHEWCVFLSFCYAFLFSNLFFEFFSFFHFCLSQQTLYVNLFAIVAKENEIETHTSNSEKIEEEIKKRWKKCVKCSMHVELSNPILISLFNVKIVHIENEAQQFALKETAQTETVNNP